MRIGTIFTRRPLADQSDVISNRRSLIYAKLLDKDIDDLIIDIDRAVSSRPTDKCQQVKPAPVMRNEGKNRQNHIRMRQM